MANEKTEQPTPKRLRDARKKGQVSKSADLTHAFLFLTAANVLMLTGSYSMELLRSFMVHFFEPSLLRGNIGENAIVAHIGSAFSNLLRLSLPLLGALFVTAIGLNFLQIGGFIFSFESLSPKFSKLNPAQGFQNLFFKGKTYLELAKTLIKFAVISWIAYSTFRANVRDVILSARVGLIQTAALASSVMFALLFKVGGVFLILGAADFMLQKKIFMKSLMMTKDEVKREYKEEEGDPEIKYKRKHLYQELLSQQTLNNVRKADTVVVNPTHFAIALRYDQKQMSAPQVTAKGQMLMAQRIIDIAKESRVPIVRNVALAHKLYEVEIGFEIPEDLYPAVAEILNFVYELAKT